MTGLPGHEDIKDDISIMREWISKQPYLPQDLEDHFLAQFICNSKGSLERAKQILDKYFLVRQSIPDFFHNRSLNWKRDLEFLNIAYYVEMPTRTPEGCGVVWGGVLTKDTTNFSNDSLYRIVLSVTDIVFKDDLDAGSTGVICVLDHSNVTFAHNKDFTPMFAKKVVSCLEGALPRRIKGIHIINASPLLDYFFSLIKSLTKKKTADRFHVHSTMETFYKYVPKECVPEEFGGTATPIKQLREQWRNRLEDHREWFMAEEERRHKEYKFRPKDKNISEMDGTFRKLTID